ncbi:hypothetical protein Aduo_015738 [Ancylostoma duodenale]
MPSFDETAEYKAQLVSALHLAWNDAAERARLYKENMKVQYDKTARPSLIQVGDRVLFRNFTNKVGLSRKLCFPWIGQFRVISVDFPHATIVSITSPRAQPRKVHLNQIKKFLDPTGPASTLPGIPEEEASFTPPNGGETVDEESHEISERSVSDTPVQQHPRLPSHGYNLRSTRKQQ